MSGEMNALIYINAEDMFYPGFIPARIMNAPKFTTTLQIEDGWNAAAA